MKPGVCAECLAPCRRGQWVCNGAFLLPMSLDVPSSTEPPLAVESEMARRRQSSMGCAFQWEHRGRGPARPPGVNREVSFAMGSSRQLGFERGRPLLGQLPVFMEFTVSSATRVAPHPVLRCWVFTNDCFNLRLKSTPEFHSDRFSHCSLWSDGWKSGEDAGLSSCC